MEVNSSKLSISNLLSAARIQLYLKYIHHVLQGKALAMGIVLEGEVHGGGRGGLFSMLPFEHGQ